jgi:MFS family permease
MTLRASLGGAVVLFAMGLVRTPELLLVLRMLQGALTGTVIANLTLVVSNTPEKRIGFAIGIMNSAVFVGNAIGPLVGGYFADLFGFRIAFFLSSITLFLAFFVALFWVREDFAPQVAPGPPRIFRGMAHLIRENRILPFVALFALVALARFSPRPMYPLLVKEIAAVGLGVATQAGLINATAGVAAVLAGIAVGRLADRGKPLVLGMFCASLAGVFLLPQGFMPTVWSLMPLVFLADFSSAGVNPIMNILLSRQVPVERRGTAFGISGSARAVGWSLGAMLGGILAAYLDFKAVFINAAILFLIGAFLLSRLHRRGSSSESAGVEQRR